MLCFRLLSRLRTMKIFFRGSLFPCPEALRWVSRSYGLGSIASRYLEGRSLGSMNMCVTRHVGSERAFRILASWSTSQATSPRFMHHMSPPCSGARALLACQSLMGF